jgi:small subunit ribosomal protein S6
VYTTKRTYESLYIVDATLTDEQLDSIIAKYSKVITDQGGVIRAAGKWDKRRLAYEIKGRREGTYILTYFDAEPAVAKELDRLFRIADEVIRHIILKIEPRHIDTARLEAQAARSAEEDIAEVEVGEEIATAEETEAETASEDTEANAEVGTEPTTEESATEESQVTEAESVNEDSGAAPVDAAEPETDEANDTEEKAE